MNMLSRLLAGSLLLGLTCVLITVVLLFGLVWYAVVFSLGLNLIVSWVGYSVPVAILLMGACECVYWLIGWCYE